MLQHEQLIELEKAHPNMIVAQCVEFCLEHCQSHPVFVRYIDDGRLDEIPYPAFHEWVKSTLPIFQIENKDQIENTIIHTAKLRHTAEIQLFLVKTRMRFMHLLYRVLDSLTVSQERNPSHTASVWQKECALDDIEALEEILQRIYDDL